MSNPYEAFIAAVRSEHEEEAEPWLARVDHLIAELCGRWELETGEPLRGDGDGYVVEAIRGRRDPVVLRIAYPDGWFEQQTAALAHWEGRGAIELLDHDARGAQLLERAIPGTSLLDEPDEDHALELAADVAEQLWIPDPGDVEPVATEAAEWAASMDQRNEDVGSVIDEDLVEEARELLVVLPAEQRERVLLHGDLHFGNIVAARRRPWLAVDPQPLVGEREFDVTALVRDRRAELVTDVEAGQARVQRRFDRLSKRLHCDRERLKGWSVGIMVDYALWSFESGDREGGIRDVAVARMLQALTV